MLEILIIFLFSTMMFATTSMSLILILALVVVLNIYFIIKDKIKVKMNSITFYMLIIFLLANMKNVFLYLFSNLTLFSLLYSFGELYLFFLFILLIKNRDLNKFQNIFKYAFWGGFIIATYMIITKNYIVLPNHPIVLMLPYVMSNKINSVYLKVFLGVLYLSYGVLLEARGVLVTYFYFLIITAFDEKRRNTIFKLSFVTITLVYFYAISNYLDPQINELLTNRPLIWRYYIDDIISNTWNVIFGQGRMSEGVAGAAADEVMNYVQRGVKEEYSPHNFYLYYIYEHGIVFTLIIVFLLFRALKNTNSFKPELMSFLILGFTSPMKIGGFGILSLFFTIYLVLSLNDIRTKVSIET
ncbi:hypothetical protein ACRTEV_13050 [Rossellomorea arthrocnemi]